MSKQAEIEVRGRGWRPNAPRPMTEGRKNLFLRELARHGVVASAAAAASPHSHDEERGCLSSFYALRARDPDFAAAWDEAMKTARGVVERELHRRAVEGYEEPVFYRGEEVGKVRKYSDRLLELRIRALAPEYRPTAKIEHGGTMEFKDSGLQNLSSEKRRMLRLILEEQVKDAELVETGNGDERLLENSAEE